jgi:hypothetical protein
LTRGATVVAVQRVLELSLPRAIVKPRQRGTLGKL